MTITLSDDDYRTLNTFINENEDWLVEHFFDYFLDSAIIAMDESERSKAVDETYDVARSHAERIITAIRNA